MNTQISITLGVIILGAIGFDLFTTGGDSLLFLTKKLVELIEWLAFWR